MTSTQDMLHYLHSSLLLRLRHPGGRLSRAPAAVPRDPPEPSSSIRSVHRSPYRVLYRAGPDDAVDLHGRLRLACDVNRRQMLRIRGRGMRALMLVRLRRVPHTRQVRSVEFMHGIISATTCSAPTRHCVCPANAPEALCAWLERRQPRHQDLGMQRGSNGAEHGRLRCA